MKYKQQITGFISEVVEIARVVVVRLVQVVSTAGYHLACQYRQGIFVRAPYITQSVIVAFALTTLFVSGLSHFPRNIEIPVKVAAMLSEETVVQDEGEVAIQDPPYVKPMRLVAVSSKYDPIIFNIARELDVDPALVKAVIHSESGFDQFAVSRRGASGLMQLMPETAVRFSVQDPFDAEQNIRGGVRFLKHLLATFDNDERLAVAAYNAGPGRVRYYGDVPPFIETSTYVRKVLGLRKLYSDFSDFKDESDKSFAALEMSVST